MFRGLKTPVIFLQNVVVDLLLGLGFVEAFRIFADHVRTRYDAEPGFITMNLPRLLDALDSVGIDNPIVCSNINKIGFRMSGGMEAYERRLRERAVPRHGDVGVRVRGDPAAGGASSGCASSPASSRSSSVPRAAGRSRRPGASSTRCGVRRGRTSPQASRSSGVSGRTCAQQATPPPLALGLAGRKPRVDARDRGAWTLLDVRGSTTVHARPTGPRGGRGRLLLPSGLASSPSRCSLQAHYVTTRGTPARSRGSRRPRP